MYVCAEKKDEREYHRPVERLSGRGNDRRQLDQPSTAADRNGRWG